MKPIKQVPSSLIEKVYGIRSNKRDRTPEERLAAIRQELNREIAMLTRYHNKKVKEAEEALKELTAKKEELANLKKGE